MSLVLILMLAAQTPQGAAIAGNYAAVSEAGAQCSLVLMPPARRPSGAMAMMSGAAGLAAVSPDCELALSEAMFWQFEEEGSGRLVLVDPAGETVFAGEPGGGERQWQGATGDGVRVWLERNR